MLLTSRDRHPTHPRAYVVPPNSRKTGSLSGAGAGTIPPAGRFTQDLSKTDGTDMTEIDEIRKRLEAHGQSHLLGFYEELSPEHRKLLLQQIQTIDLDQLEGWIERYVRRSPRIEVPQDITPPEIIPYGGGGGARKAQRRGEELLAAGKVAAFTVAGGQGTRLGYEGPKGCLPASPVVKKPLFRLLAEQIRAAGLRWGVSIP